MAEIKQTITIDANNATKTLKEYKKEVKSLEKDLSKLKEGSKEYYNTLEQLQAAQEQYNTALGQSSEETSASGVSIVELKDKLKELKAQFNETTSAVQRAKLKDEMAAINNQLTAMQGGIGGATNRIGAFEGAFKAAFKTSLKGLVDTEGALGVISGQTKAFLPVIYKTAAAATKGLHGIRRAIASTGIGLLIVAVTTLIQHWEAFKKTVGISQGQMDSFKKKATDVIQTVINLVKKLGGIVAGTLTSINGGVVRLIKGLTENFSKLTGAFTKLLKGNFSEAWKDLKSFGAGVGKEMTKIWNFKENFQLGVDGFNKVWDAAGAGIAKVGKKVGEFIDNIKAEGEEAVETLDKIKENAAKPPKEEDAWAKWFQRQISSIDLALQQEIAKISKETDDLEERAKKIEEARMNALEVEKQMWTQYLEHYNGNIDKQIEAQQKLTAIELKEIEARDQARAEALKAEEERLKREQELLKERYQTEETLANIRANEQKLEAIQTIENQEELKNRLVEIELELLEERRRIMQEQLAMYEEGSQEYLALQEQISATSISIAEKTNEKNKKLSKDEVKTKKDVTNDVIDAYADMFGSIAGLFEEGSKAQKAFQVTETVLSTISGAQKAWNSAMALPFPMNYAVGAASVAATLAKGAASVKNIMKTTKENAASTLSAESSIGAGVSISPLINESVDVQRMQSLNVTSDSDRAQSSQAQRVYVVESDIRDVSKRVEVTENESRF